MSEGNTYQQQQQQGGAATSKGDAPSTGVERGIVDDRGRDGPVGEIPGQHKQDTGGMDCPDGLPINKLDHDPWSKGPMETGLDWPEKNDASSASGNILSGFFQSIVGEGLAELKNGGNGLDWGSNGITQKSEETWRTGKPESFDLHSGFGPITKPDRWGSLIETGLDQGGGWPVSAEAPGSAEKRESPSVWGGQGDAKPLEVRAPQQRSPIDPIGPLHRRSSSAAESLSSGDERHGGDPARGMTPEGRLLASLVPPPLGAPSGDKKDERSQPDGAEVAAQQDKEELIAKLVSSNEGWGRKPIRQDVPWHTGELASCDKPAVDAPKAEPQPAAAPVDGMFWNQPQAKDQSGLYWGGCPPPTDFSAEGNIGFWGAPEPTASNPPTQWQVPPPLKGLTGGADFGGFRGGMGGLGAMGGAMLAEALAKDGRFASGDNGGFTMSPAALRMPPPTTPVLGAGGSMWDSRPPFLSGGRDASAAGSIGHWDPSNAASETVIGTWGQPALNQQKTNGPLGGVTGNPYTAGGFTTLQQLMDLGLGREEALMLLKNNGGKIQDLLGGAGRPMTAEPQKGRMLRGKADFPPPHDAAFQGLGGAHFPPFPSNLFSRPPGGNQMSRGGPFPSSLSAGLGGFQGRGGGSFAAQQQHQQRQPQFDVQISQSLLFLQSELQPLLHRRSQLQQNALLTPQQKQQLLEPLNQRIAIVKLQIDQCQAPPLPDLGQAGRFLGAPPPASGVFGGQPGRGMGQFGAGGGGSGFCQPPPAAAGRQDLLRALAELNLSDDPLTAQLLAQLNLKGADIDGLLGALQTPGGALGLEGDATLAGGSHWADQSELVRSLSAFGPPPSLSSPGGQADMLRGGGGGGAGGDLFPSVEAWSGGGGPGGSTKVETKLSWPQFGGGRGEGGRGGSMMPPGLGGTDGTGLGWNTGTSVGGQSGLWESVRDATSVAGNGSSGNAAPTNWLLLKNLRQQMDGTMVQTLCEQHKPTAVFLLNRAAGQALACYASAEDAALTERIVSTLCLTSGLPIGAELMGNEAVMRLLDGARAQWACLPATGAAARQGHRAGDSM